MNDQILIDLPQSGRRHWLGMVALSAGQFLLPTRSLANEPLGIVLPTRNRMLFSDPSKFYMYVDRSFEGRAFREWRGGKYGYVRNPYRTKDGVIYTKFHEGIDIAPWERDANGEPLDVVRAIAKGKVVYLNDSPGSSSYGRYVVVQHNWGYGYFYSLYAHLKSISTTVETEVMPGAPLGILGYTGVGLDRARAHLHLELCLILDNRFQRWHEQNFSDKNFHGMYNGLNLIGIDIAGLYLAHEREPRITIPQFMARMDPYFKVAVPRNGSMQLIGNYPFLIRDLATGAGKKSWEITFSASGVPLEVRPLARETKSPTVTWVKHSSLSHTYATRGRLTGVGAEASLSSAGLRYVDLLAGRF